MDGLVVGFDDVLDDGESQAFPFFLCCSSLFGAEKAVEQPGDVFLVDADAVVGDLDQDVFFHVEEADLDAWFFFPAVADGVVDEVDQHLAYLVDVGLHHQAFLRGFHHPDVDVAFAGFHLEEIDRFMHHVDDVEGGEAEFQFTGFEAGDALQVFDDGDEAVDAFLGPFQVFLVDGGIVEAAFEEGGDVSLDVEDRSFEFMADVADILAAIGFECAEVVDLLAFVLVPFAHLFFHVFHEAFEAEALFAVVFFRGFIAADGFVDHTDLVVDEPFDAKIQQEEDKDEADQAKDEKYPQGLLLFQVDVEDGGGDQQQDQGEC